MVGAASHTCGFILDSDLLFFACSYLAAGASFDAAKVIARKNDVTSLRAASTLAKISGEPDLAQSLALRCAKDLAASLDWVGAQEVLSSQENLLVRSSGVLKMCLGRRPGAPRGRLTFVFHSDCCRSTGSTSAPPSCWPPCWQMSRVSHSRLRPVTPGPRQTSGASASRSA